MTTSLHYISNGKTYVLDDYVNSVSWSGSVMEGYRTLDVSLNATTNGRTKDFQIHNGREIRFFNDGKELFRGVVFTRDTSANGEMSITAYDEYVYLAKNTESRIFKNQRADQIFKRLCSDFGVSVGTVANTGYVIPKYIADGKSLKDIIITTLTLTKKQTGKRFFVYAMNGKLNLIERKTNVKKWVIENGTNLIDASYSVSMEDLRNQVKVIGGDEKKPIVATVQNGAYVKAFGKLQHVENGSDIKTKSQAESLARQLLKDLSKLSDEARVEALGIDDVIAGSAIYVIESMTGLKGGYYVATDSHTFEGGTHTMSLTLTKTDELPEMEV